MALLFIVTVATAELVEAILHRISNVHHLWTNGYFNLCAGTVVAGLVAVLYFGAYNRLRHNAASQLEGAATITNKVYHELNQPLQVVLLNAEMMQMLEDKEELVAKAFIKKITYGNVLVKFLVCFVKGIDGKVPNNSVLLEEELFFKRSGMKKFN